MDDVSIPAFNLDGINLDALREELHVISVPTEEVSETPIQPEVPKRRGRPRGSRNRTSAPVVIEQEGGDSALSPLQPAKLTKRDEREVADRLQKLLTGLTGMAAIASKPYLEMTPAEAQDISAPLSTYLVRNADTIPIAGQILENYDLAAIVVGIMAYVVRVYRDRQFEVATATTKQETGTRVVKSGASSSERPEVREASEGDAFTGGSYGIPPRL